MSSVCTKFELWVIKNRKYAPLVLQYHLLSLFVFSQFMHFLAQTLWSEILSAETIWHYEALRFRSYVDCYRIMLILVTKFKFMFKFAEVIDLALKPFIMVLHHLNTTKHKQTLFWLSMLNKNYHCPKPKVSGETKADSWKWFDSWSISHLSEAEIRI